MNATRVCRCGHIRNQHRFLLGGCSGTGNDRLSSWSCGCAKFLDARTVDQQRATLPVPNQPRPMVVDSKTTEVIGRLWRILQMEKCGFVYGTMVICDASLNQHTIPVLPTDGAEATL